MLVRLLVVKVCCSLRSNKEGNYHRKLVFTRVRYKNSFRYFGIMESFVEGYVFCAKHQNLNFLNIISLYSPSQRIHSLPNKTIPQRYPSPNNQHFVTLWQRIFLIRYFHPKCTNTSPNFKFSKFYFYKPLFVTQWQNIDI